MTNRFNGTKLILSFFLIYIVVPSHTPNNSPKVNNGDVSLIRLLKLDGI